MPLPKSEIRLSPQKTPPGIGRLGLRTINTIAHNPLDIFSRLATAEGYDKERLSARELHMSLTGEHTDHHITLSWSRADELLQLFLVFDGKLPQGRDAELYHLLSLINERLTAGHFVLWRKDNALVYRQTIRLSGQARINMDQAMAIMDDALLAAETGYPAFQFMVWGGLSPEEALDQALISRAGTAS